MKNGGFVKVGLVFVAMMALSATMQMQRASRRAETVVTVQGILQAGEFLGPPGYGEDPAHDARETSYYLQLPAPIEEQNPGVQLGSEFDHPLEHFAQLVPPSGQQLKPLVGKRVSVTAVPMPAATGHHRTGVVLIVQRVSAISDWHW
jgi:hypothetical protein